MAQAPARACSLTTLQAKQGCFTCLSKSERLHLKVWFLIKLYEALGGTPMTTAEALEAAACFGCEPESVLDAFEVAIWQAAASRAGATVDGTDVADLTAAELKAAIKCYPCADPKLLKAGYTYGLCEVLSLAVAAPVPT
jgi:hypothetical protein